MNIGQAAAASGVSAKMIRYYEGVGLVGSPARTHGNYRDFGPREINELRFIRLTRDLGFSVEEIAQLLSLWRDRGRPADEVQVIARSYLTRLEARIAAVQGVAATLHKLAALSAAGERPDFPSLPDPVDPTSEPAPPTGDS